MEHLDTYILTYALFFTLIILIGQIFNKSIFPITILLVLAGIILSLIPHFPKISLDPDIVLQIFLPLLVYQISSFSSWYEFKKNLRPIALLSVGHVIFITGLVALVMHSLLPELGWPLAFILGAAVAPPDDVAIVSIAEKIRLPRRVVTILEGEGLLNDATALIIFRFSIAALLTHHFSPSQALSAFLLILIGESLYGFFLGELLGRLRMKIQSTPLHMMASLLTPFLAFFPPFLLGGSGILSTVFTGFVIGHRYALRFSPEFRLVSRGTWPMISFGINCIIFLLVGLDMPSIMERIAPLPFHDLIVYVSALIATIILGRFFWVYIAMIILPRVLFPSILKKDPYPPWQFPFLVSWAGMRGGISLAIALALPALPNLSLGTNPKELILFLVFSVIIVTFLIQGLTLPWMIKLIRANVFGEKEAYDEHLSELTARLSMTKAVLRWLKKYRIEFNQDPTLQDHALSDQLKLYIKEYQNLKNDLIKRIDHHQGETNHDEREEVRIDMFLMTQIIEVERSTLMDLWRRQKINLETRNKLSDRLDHQAKHLPG